MVADVRRYFIGLTGFAFVMCWATAGLLVAIGALAVCLVIVLGPEASARRRRARRPRAVRARPLVEERHGEHQLVPDDPSLVIELV